jgi:hypothetical protein
MASLWLQRDPVVRTEYGGSQGGDAGWVEDIKTLWLDAYAAGAQ